MNLYEKIVGFFKSSKNTNDNAETSLEELRVVDLREIAKSRGLKGYTQLKKADLVTLISQTS
tara:strand:+ start:386 stop:571 length:186 start_codon:yes stop_codon:yes gene_type:complete